MSERSFLAAEDEIVLCNETGEKRFTIRSLINAGATAVGYEAYHDKSGWGVLKEFYPEGNYSLERGADGYLVALNEFQSEFNRFQEEKSAYIKPYEMLMAPYRNNDNKDSKENKDLQKFIPPFEIYYGRNESEKNANTVYIWTPVPAVEATFDKICDEIHNYPDINPEHKLAEVLCAINTLTKCICVLHQNELVHRDIKPSNFGFVRLGEETFTQNIALFDIDSVCPVGQDDDSVGTEGFLEPEWGKEPARNQTDIYAIGATLFYAIVVTEETKKAAIPYTYNESYYDRIHKLVNESKLIQASERNRHPRVIDSLTTIFQRCLGDRASRYENCEQLLEDLDNVLFYVFPTDVALRHQSGDIWVLKEAEKSFDIKREKNSMLAIQCHLFEHPLYKCVSKDFEGEERINVLVIGFGNYGQKFLDACLQAGQIRNNYLNVTVISNDGHDKEIYLGDNRPELGKFFNIDGSLDNGPIERKDYYGDITFKTKELQRGNEHSNKEYIEDIMIESLDPDQKGAYYIFIALGEDNLNRDAAYACKEAAEILDVNDVLINYISESKQEEEATHADDGIACLYVNKDMKQNQLYNAMERMAFNTHLVWKKDLNIDYAEAKREFLEPYNHDSCVGYVLSLKYKLYSIGIDLDQDHMSYEEAARVFSEKFSDSKEENIWNELIWIEHRRWVTEKLCLGWTKKEVKDCVSSGETNDKDNKKHVCILRSRPDQILDHCYGNHEQWDTIKKKDLEKMDELDKMSVNLHREYSKKAKGAMKENFLRGPIVTGIKDMIRTKKESDDAFNEWLSCMNDIWNGNTARVCLYEGLRDAFLGTLITFSEYTCKLIKKQVEILEGLFTPILESRRYRIWKQDDVALVDNIPFILTFTTNTCMVIPYKMGDASALFQNAAAPIVVNPEKIIYVYYPQGKTGGALKRRMDEVLGSLTRVLNFLNKKNVRSEIGLIVVAQKKEDEKFIKEMNNEKDEALAYIQPVMGKTENKLLQTLEDVFPERRTDTSLFMIEENNEPSSKELLQKIASYNSFPRYRFNSEKIQFETLLGCDMLNYIKKQPYISVAEMLTLTSPSGQDQYQPEFFDDYNDLWRRYHDNPKVWKDFSNLLKKYHESDYMVSFKKLPHESGNEETYYYSMPYTCEKSIIGILGFLKDKKIIEQSSQLEAYSHTSDACRVVIKDKCSDKDTYDKLFSNVYAFMDPEAILIGPSHNKEADNSWGVWFDNLKVDKIRVEAGDENKGAKGIIELAGFFAQKGFLLNCNCEENRSNSTGEITSYSVRFTYGSRQIKKLLSKAGEMLEVYVYHRLKESCQFNDVVKGHETLKELPGGQGERTTGEIDCIVTKGFRSCFIECKAREMINPDDIAREEKEAYETLDKRRKDMGINATAVLIADTNEEKDPTYAEHNRQQRADGREKYGIITVWKRAEIDNIENTIIQIMEGTYEAEI